MYYSFIDKEISHEKFSLIITSYYFYYRLKLYLNKNNKIFENLDNFRFFVLKKKFMCTANSHQLWLRNIYDHGLMVLSMVPKYLHESNQNIFF